jgi:hypothetical protein
MRPFDSQLSELGSFRPRGARILSLYLRTNPVAVDTPAVMEELHGVVRGLRGSLDATGLEQLDEDLSAVRDYLGSMVAPPPAVAIFTCASRRFFRVVRLPLDVAPAVYWADEAVTAPLLDAVRRADQAFGARLTETVPL